MASWRTCIRSVTWGCFPSPPNEPSPISRPTSSPWSKSFNRAHAPRCSARPGCFTGKKNVKRAGRRGTAPRLGARLSYRRAARRRAGGRLLALAVRLDVVARSSGARARPFARSRSSARARPGAARGRPPLRPGRRRPQSNRPALAVTGGIDGRRRWRRRRPLKAIRYARCWIASIVSPWWPISSAEIVADVLGVSPSSSSVTSTSASTPPSSAIISSARSGVRRALDGHRLHGYLRRPDRFFFLRGGCGGGPVRRRRGDRPVSLGALAAARGREDRRRPGAVEPDPFGRTRRRRAAPGGPRSRPPPRGRHRDRRAPGAPSSRRLTMCC